MRRLIVTAVLALTLVSSAGATTLDDLRGLGYTVARATDCNDAGTWKTTWSVSGFGLSTYLSECAPSFQAELDSLANPTVHFERVWQHEHPEQLAAAQAIAAKCYSIGRAAAGADSWRITAILVDLTVPGADLPGLAATLPDKKALDGTCTGTTVAVVPNTDTGGIVTVPGQVEIPAAAAPVEEPATEASADEPAAAEVVAQPVATSAEVNAASVEALAEAQAEGLSPDEAALAARSAGLNTLYGIDS